MTTCKERVNAGYHEVSCGKKAGHGPDGLYCAQHGKVRDIAAGNVKSETWYQLDRFGKIRPLEVFGETATMVQLAHGKNWKESDYFSHFKTEIEAVTVLRDRLRREVESLANRLDKAKAELADAEKRLQELSD